MNGPRCTRHREPASRHPQPGPFVQHDEWWPTDNPAVESFCKGAFLVDDHSWRNLFGTQRLALRTHLPDELARFDLVNNEADFENLTSTFYTLEFDDLTVRYWRCDVDWLRPRRRVYSIAGPAHRVLFGQVLIAHSFTLVQASIWNDWEWRDAPLTVRNDLTTWFRCSA